MYFQTHLNNGVFLNAWINNIISQKCSGPSAVTLSPILNCFIIYVFSEQKVSCCSLSLSLLLLACSFLSFPFSSLPFSWFSLKFLPLSSLPSASLNLLYTFSYTYLCLTPPVSPKPPSSTGGLLLSSASQESHPSSYSSSSSLCSCYWRVVRVQQHPGWLRQ